MADTMSSINVPVASDGGSGRVQQIAGKAREQAQAARSTVGTRVTEEVDKRSTTAGEQVTTFAQALRKTGQELEQQGQGKPSNLVNQAADRLEGLGAYLRDNDGDTIMSDLERFARQQPYVVAGVGALLGLAAARFLKASQTSGASGTSYATPPPPATPRARTRRA